MNDGPDFCDLADKRHEHAGVANARPYSRRRWARHVSISIDPKSTVTLNSSGSLIFDGVIGAPGEAR